MIMLDHVLSALVNARTIETVTVICADRNVARIVRKKGARFIWEERRRGLNSAINLAQRKLGSSKRFSVVIIHADLPLLDQRDVEAFVRTVRRYQVGVAPAKDGTGTNALFLESPNLIRTKFGRKSFSKHLSLLRSHGLRYKIIRFPRIGFDLDTVEDVNLLVQSSTQNEVCSFLREKLRTRISD